MRIMLGGLCVLIASVGSAAWHWASRPRPWGPGEVPIAFWSWRTIAPSDDELKAAVSATGARIVFLRAGQFDFDQAKVGRIRAVEGKLPQGLELHLVYNATRDLISAFERVDEATFATAIAEAYRKDIERASKDGATVRGIQLDFDSPTRLLARYARLIRATREQLPPNTSLSITGLPTWMDSSVIKDVMADVDFWAPQFYGASIPERADQVVPISSSTLVAKDVDRARKLGKPFYAGVAAYGYALVYSEKGDLVALRGDLEPTLVARNSDFELVERRAFATQKASDGANESEWRYDFRALADTAAGGFVVRAGEHVVFNLPSSESLRASVREVRNRAGNKLLGILIFRLPTNADSTTLSMEQIAAALSDRGPRIDVGVRASTGQAQKDGSRDALLLTATNTGVADAALGDSAVEISVRVPRGSILGIVDLEGFDSFETLCSNSGSHETMDILDNQRRLRPCSALRSDVIRLKANVFTSGTQSRARLRLSGDLAQTLAATVSMHVDDGRLWRRDFTIKVES